jgi:2-polyprenyl-3-methyl-5-hydroxy-6-metoxy-1,4-benzoquinol methylase
MKRNKRSLTMKILNLERWLFEWRYWRGRTPWDTRITPPEVEAFLVNATPGRALDLGCGTGTNAITLARHGWEVTGIDFAARAIRSARRKAAQAGLRIDFRAGDVTDLSGLTGLYDYVLDIGCLHSLDPVGQVKYAAELEHVVQPGGQYMLYAWLPKQWGNTSRGLSPEQVGLLFAPAFAVTRTALGGERGMGSAWHWLVKT